ncbi:MAG: hypothetical protein ACIAQF_11615 [Phycisphaerales bacterium JB065]
MAEASPTPAADQPDNKPPADSQAPATHAGDDSMRLVLLVMIVANQSMLDDLVTAMLDLGIQGTIIESKGLMSLLRDEMPIFSGLAAMIPQRTGSRVVLSVTAAGEIDQVFSFLQNELSDEERPIAFTVPIDRFMSNSKLS